MSTAGLLGCWAAHNGGAVQGPFDFINFANHADIEPVFVTTSTTSVQDFAELVECKSLYGYSLGLCARQPG